ncbi:hypothetical protein SAMN04488505_11466 [Chitinophaga rupis]|uniref:Uncharacterized protein n=1 Tax=Chitinophaga rupis TaxID=573321 RepID=A0A1H8K8Q2_9BACT|nr:hypothetical protein [Chitinophaga rupis]SEN89392.1 hypothetical protein SAMN04488505_11466 [Chitinophaga rupis]
MKVKKTDPVKTNVTKLKINPLQKLKNAGYFILVLAGVYALIYGLAKFASWSEHQSILEIKESHTSTIGTIIKVGSMKGSYAVAEYFVDGKRYERKDDSPASGIFTGEHYLIIYKATNPAISRIDFTNPVFLNGEETGKTTGTIVYKDWAKVGFTYTVNGERIKRFQKYVDGKQLKKGQTLTVEYLLSNPGVSILKLK